MCIDTHIIEEVVWRHRSVLEYFPGSHAPAFTVSLAMLCEVQQIDHKLGPLTNQDNPKQYDLQVSTVQKQ